ncbi:MAG TPA: hypothetical protein VG755_28650 [Nannocystaceae bacterium]|nr:hypothetical protein [Nannocystaceae bacterium]
MRTRIGSLLVLVVAGGCSFGTIAQLRKPQPAAAPAAKSFPEAERMLPAAARSNADLGTIERAYVMDSRWTGDAAERAVGVLVFTSRKGGALVKDEHGSPDHVCFRHACALAQDRVGGGYGPAYVQCIEQAIQKVTCDSVEALPPGVAL